MRIEVRAEVRLTEDEDKVRRAVLNLFDADEIEIEEANGARFLVARSEGARCLRKLYRLLRERRILDAAREHVRRGTCDMTVVVHLNKQAAYMGIVSFCSIPDKESPMGPISLIVSCDDPLRFANWLTPRTSKGKPVGEELPPDCPQSNSVSII